MTAIDARLEPAEREALIAEVTMQLPLWLQRAAHPQPQASDQLVDLLGFAPSTLRRVRAVHAVLSDSVLAFADGLPLAMRRPRPDTERPVELSGVVRGPVDWASTMRLQALGQPATFVVMPRRRVFDTPEHRALAWVLVRLENLTALALGGADDDAPDPQSWTAAAQHVRSTVYWARRVDWITGLRPDRPDRRARARLHRSRNPFIAGPLSSAIDALLEYERADGPALASLLAQRYFVPERDWRLFEVVVLVRLDQALAAAADGVRRTLMSDSGQVGVYRLAEGDPVRLRYQSWPSGPSRRRDTGMRHGITVTSSKPDIIVERIGGQQDRLILELKASRNPGTLGDGLSQLLGYLYERPALFTQLPAGWLVPLAGAIPQEHPADSSEPLWIVPANSVAEAVIARMAPQPTDPDWLL